jgi:hypothetical protein
MNVFKIEVKLNVFSIKFGFFLFKNNCAKPIVDIVPT